MPDRDPETLAMLRDFLIRQQQMHVENRADGVTRNEILEKLSSKVDQLDRKMTEAFPGNDPDGHRRYHEEVMRILEARRRFWEGIRNALAQWGAIGVAGFIVIAIFFYVKSRLSQ